MFEITMIQETLMTILNYLDSTVGKNSQSMGDDCISMTSSDTGSCIFYTTNTIEFTIIEAVCANKTQQATAPFVNFKRFKGIIATIPSTEYITIKEGAGELLLSFAMRKIPLKIKASTNNMIPMPQAFANLPSDMIDMPMDFFSKTISKANSIVSESNSATLMNCVKFTIGNPDVSAEAIDVLSKRTFFMTEKFGTSPIKTEFLIEAAKMNSSLKLFEDFVDIEIGKDGSTVVLKGNNRPALYNRKHQNASNDIITVMYCARQLSGVFPNIAQYYTKNYMPVEYITINKQDILNSIARIKALGDSTSFLTGINLKADTSEFTSSFNSQYGTLEDPIDVINPVKGSFNMIFNHKQFEDLLKSIDAIAVDIGVMQGSNGSNFVIKGNLDNSGAKYTDTDMFSMLSMNLQQTP